MRQGLRAKLAASKPLFGLFINYPAPALVELAGHSGYDWAFLDAEHGPLGTETIENMVRAAETAGIVPLVRLPYPDASLVNRYLDTGAMGVLVPHIHDADRAREFVRAAKYHPAGERGAGSRTRAADFGYRLSASDYAAWADRETMIFGIVEDRDALEQLPAMLEVDGIDGFVVGPSDLSQALGVPGQIAHPDVVRVIDKVTQAVLRSTKLLCRVLTNAETAAADAAAFAQMGVHLIAEPYTGIFSRGARPVLGVRPRTQA